MALHIAISKTTFRSYRQLAPRTVKVKHNKNKPGTKKLLHKKAVDSDTVMSFSVRRCVKIPLSHNYEKHGQRIVGTTSTSENCKDTNIDGSRSYLSPNMASEQIKFSRTKVFKLKFALRGAIN